MLFNDSAELLGLLIFSLIALGMLGSFFIEEAFIVLFLGSVISDFEGVFSSLEISLEEFL